MLQALLLGAVLFATPPATPHALKPTTQEDEVPPKDEKLESWPKPANPKVLDKDILKLRKANTEEMGAQAKADLEAAGASAAPALLNALGKEKDEEAQARICEVLTAITSAAHTRVLAREIEHKSVRVRIWVLERIAAFPDHGIGADILAHLDALKQKGERADPKELFAAALCTLSTGQIAGLDVVFDVAVESWSRHSAQILVAAREVRGEVATSVLAHHLSTGDRKHRVTALRLLASCGDPTKALPLIAPLLDENDNSIRIAAINALRGIVDGEPPIEKLPVFEAIELAREWKKRIG